MRAGTDSTLARVVRVFGTAGATPSRLPVRQSTRQSDEGPRPRSDRSLAVRARLRRPEDARIDRPMRTPLVRAHVRRGSWIAEADSLPFLCIEGAEVRLVERATQVDRLQPVHIKAHCTANCSNCQKAQPLSRRRSIEVPEAAQSCGER